MYLESSCLFDVAADEAAPFQILMVVLTKFPKLDLKDDGILSSNMLSSFENKER